MSNDNTTVTRSNFASRLLHKAMTDRAKPAAKQEGLTTAEAAKFAVATESKEAVVAAKS